MPKHQPGSTIMTFREFSEMGSFALAIQGTKHLAGDEHKKTLEDWLGDLCVHALAIDENRHS